MTISLNTVYTIIAILAGSGVITRGVFRVGTAQLRKARAAEDLAARTAKLLDELTVGHQSHVAHYALLEAQEWQTQTQQQNPRPAPLLPRPGTPARLAATSYPQSPPWPATPGDSR